MEPTGVYIIRTHEQLKALSDPLRTKILMNLVKGPYTGQQLAEQMGITRNNIYFHLKELEKHGVIQVVKREEKNGIMQKYYRAVSGRFIPEEHLLPSLDLVETSRQVFMETVQLTREKIQLAPGASFALDSSNQEQWKNIAGTYQFYGTAGSFTAFLNDFKALVEKHFSKTAQGTQEERSYYMSLVAFQDSQETRSSEAAKGRIKG
ncbi:ArsR family transcriptional regulator [Paenibacillus sp. CAA11]|nr:ArsR family transcriptional regulator [Paenibacillus sp. CAA11]